MANKDIRDLLVEIHLQGFHTKKLKNGHVRVLDQEGKNYVATVPGTPSDRRGMKNTMADLRRAGFDWPRDRQW